MDREAAKGDPVCRADDDDAAGRIGPPRPWAEGGRGDRAGIDDAGVRRDDCLRGDPAVPPGALAHLPDELAKVLRPRRIEKTGDLRGMNFVQHLRPRLSRLREPDAGGGRPSSTLSGARDDDGLSLL